MLTGNLRQNLIDSSQYISHLRRAMMTSCQIAIEIESYRTILTSSVIAII
jgi:hypothetical protein